MQRCLRCGVWMGAGFGDLTGTARLADRSAAQRKIAGEGACAAFSSSRQVGGVEMNTTAKIVISLLAMLLPVCAQEKDDVVMKAMNDELSRTVNQLHVPDLQKPYFISYRVDDLNSATVSATLGSITQSNPLRTRIIGVEVRVGDYAFDNTNYVSAQSFGGGGMSAGVVQGPIDDDYQQVRRQLWIATDAQYKHVAEEYSAKKAALANRKRTTDVADFSKEQPATVSDIGGALAI